MRGRGCGWGIVCATVCVRVRMAARQSQALLRRVAHSFAGVRWGVGPVQGCVGGGVGCVSPCEGVGGVRWVSSSRPPRDADAGAPVGPPEEGVSDSVKALADSIVGLNLLEVSQLSGLLKSRLNLKDVPMGMPMGMPMGGMPAGGGAGGGGGAAAAAAEEEEAEKPPEKTAFGIKLEGYDAGAKVKVIKEVRAFTNLGLKEAKELVEKAPTVVLQDVKKEEAEKLIAKLIEVGAKAVLD